MIMENNGYLGVGVLEAQMLAGVLDRNHHVEGNGRVGESEGGLWLHKNLTLGSGECDRDKY
ncbi:hypothetical protein FH972_007245 [Carpinus fangiana]|uniref:Uncharacterized protein n=1 Tax=Carpinus fangiana TaxID=176857 RepID=A0A5N6QUT2_9ROSI|nr:hypothetical protein FH972_007245 [Carpinus fangiana]